MASFSHSCLLFLTLLHSLTRLTSSSPNSIPISFLNTIHHSDPFPRLTHIVSASLARAHHLKNPQTTTTTSTTQLFPYGGAYTFSLSFGTPPQSIPMVLDTGSSFSWLPCTTRYLCKSCSASTNPFLPKQSSSARFISCMNPKCGWVHTSFNPNSTCQDCQSNAVNCTQICPPYIILYGIGSTGGLAMVETLNFPDKIVPNFLVGCSLFSSNQQAGVAGFGRGTSSFPTQLNLKKFSYCLVSHKFDNTPKSSTLSMDPVSDSSRKTNQFSYTIFLDNPGRPGLSDYYYINLRKITVGGQKVHVSYQQLVPDSNGNGGTIFDSGTTFTYMNPAVWTAVANAFLMQVKNYGRDSKVESLTGLKPCFVVTADTALAMPDLKLHFKGGGAMTLPLENYFFPVDDVNRSVVCLAVVSDNSVLGPELTAGPAVILGNFLMQNYRVEFDLTNKRFGFRLESCS